jgi:hypothetical protein
MTNPGHGCHNTFLSDSSWPVRGRGEPLIPGLKAGAIDILHVNF